MDEAELKRQRWLKIIVIGLGLLILLLLGTVITTILMRGNKAEKGEASPAASTSRWTDAGYGNVKVALPSGARFEDMTPNDGKLYVRVSLASGGTEVIVLNPATGRTLGSFEFAPK
jgi:hypothetical protein